MTQPIDVYFSGYGRGIYASRLNTETGVLDEPKLIVEAKGASFIAHHPTLPVIYAVSEIGGGAVIALRRQADGSYGKISQQSSGGSGPCHLSVHPNGKALFVANYGDGRVSMLPLTAEGAFTQRVSTDQHEGSGQNAKRQDHAHAHSIYPHPDGTHIVSADLGCDALFIYSPDFETGLLAGKRTTSTEAGAGPRHIAFSFDGRFVYVVTELTNRVEVYEWTDDALTRLQSISTLPADFAGTSYCAEIRLHPSGRFLYASNRGHNSITTLRVDANSGRLEFVGTASSEGEWPRGFELDPTGKFILICSQRSDSVIVRRVDSQSGLGTDVTARIAIEKPSCVRFATSPP